ncbi:MAG: AbrB/MazE/SpoVT family DNA-binding domain-containing protein [Candidatus Woesearchaeota archaeon]
MKTSVKKWGNSYAVRIPKEIVDDLLLCDSDVDVHVENSRIILQKSSKQDILKELLKDAKKQEEISWGDACGKEFW